MPRRGRVVCFFAPILERDPTAQLNINESVSTARERAQAAQPFIGFKLIGQPSDRAVHRVYRRGWRMSFAEAKRDGDSSS